MIIIDTNVLLAFLLTDGITRRIITENYDVFMSPEHCFEELWEHKSRWNKNKLSDSELLEIVDDVKRLFVMPVPQEVYDQYITAAEKFTEKIWRAYQGAFNTRCFRIISFEKMRI